MTVSGLPGSGKTTAAREVAKRLGLRHVYAGGVFRDLARERGVSLAEFGRMAEEDADIDRALDARMVEEAQKGGAVLEGRLAAHMMRRASIPAFAFLLECSEDVRASRVAGREHGDVERARTENRDREESEAKRYRDIYGIDVDDRSVYDAVVDTSDRSPEEVVAEILAEVERGA